MTDIGFSSLAGGCLLRDADTGAEGAPALGVPTVLLREAPLLRFPGVKLPGREQGVTDCNSPAHWDGETFYLFNSAGHPSRSQGKDLFNLGESTPVQFNNHVNGGRWIEATHKDADGTLYGWYHHEPAGICPPPVAPHLTAPRIGALRSKDNGATWEDLGFILDAPPNTMHFDTANHYFVGGNGDFSVILDEQREFFYFLISTYGDLPEQGVSVARMRYTDRDAPTGKVWKWHQGNWQEPGLGGHLTPIFPALIDWHRPDANAFWGPSVHWNSHLEQYVMLLNRAKDKDWSQEGIYVSFNRDLSQPEKWSKPVKILDGGSWYPQVIGTDAAKRETDKLAGRIARFFMAGESRWEMLFLKPGEKAE